MSAALGGQRDDELLHALHDKHAHALWRYVVGLNGGDCALAHDVVQETLLRAWRSRGVLEQGGRSQTRLVVHRGEAHRHRREECIESPTTRSDRSGSRTIVDDMTQRVIDGQLVLTALRMLSPERRQVLSECYFRDASAAEAAETLGIAVGTVKSRTHNALHALRRAIDGLGGIA